MKKNLLSTYFPIILAPLILFSDTLLSGKALFWGTPAIQFIPWWDFAWDTLLAGQLPLWNPWVGMGAPLIANYQSALFYPPYWLHLVFYAAGGIKLMAWSITLLVVFHLSWGGIGIAKLMKEIKVGNLGQIVSGLAFALSGYLVAKAGFLSINATLAWLPWVMLFSKQLAGEKKEYVWKTGLVLGMMFLAGHAQTAWYTVLLGGIWVLFWSLINRSDNKYLKKSLFAVGKYIISGLIAFCISAIQMLPTIEYLLQSSRASEYGFTAAMTYSYWPWRFLTIIVPDLFGNPASGNYWGYGNYWEDSLYIGILPIVLALGTILRLINRKSAPNESSQTENNALSIFLLTICGISFLFALGKNTPVFPYLYRNIPTFNLFQAPTRFSIWAEFSLIVLAGIGIDRLKPPTDKSLYWNRLAVAGCVAISGGAALASYFLRDIKTTFISSIGIAGLWGIGTALLLLFQPDSDQHDRTKYWQYLLIGFVSLDLLVAGWGLNPAVGIDFYGVERNLGSVKRFIMPEITEYELKFKQFFKFDTFKPDQEYEAIYEHLLPNSAMIRRIEMANNFDPIVPARFKIWMDEVNKLGLATHDELPYNQALDLMEIDGISRSASDGSAWVKSYHPGIIDKVMFLSCVRYVGDDNQMLDLVFSEEIDFSNEVILEGNPEDMDELCNESKKGQIQIMEERPGYLNIEIDNLDKGWIFWSQSWYPGWIIKIDEIKAGPALRANYLFLAAEIPPGAHQVEFIYSPMPFKVGAVLTAVTLILVAYRLKSGKRRN